MVDGLRENDPYNNMPGADITPDFDEKTRREAKAEQAKNELDDAEKSATEQNEEGGLYKNGNGNTESAKGNVENARKSEEDAKGFYSGSKGKKKLGFKSFLKKKGGPIGIIFAVLAIFGVGVTSFTSVSTEIIAWKENSDVLFGQNSAVMARRSNNIVLRMLNRNRKSGTNTIFDLDLKPKAKIVNKLQENNIYVHEFATSDIDGNVDSQFRVLLYEDANGRVIPIVPLSDDVSYANRFIGQTIDIYGDGQKVLTVTDSSITLTDAMKTNEGFRTGYDTATLTLTGKIAGWFDDMADSMLTRIIGPDARNQTEMDDPDKEKVDDLMLKNKSEGVEDSDMEAKNKDVEEEGRKMSEMEFDDANGRKVTYNDVEAESDRIKTDNPSPDSVGKSLSARAQKVAMLSTTIGCAFLRGIGAINTAIGAVQTMNVISYASKYLEIADKIKAGDADEVANLALNNLNTPVKTDNLYDVDGNSVDSVYGTTTASAGFNAPFSTSNIIDENDPSALLVNREFATKNSLRQMSGGGKFADVAAEIAQAGGGMAAFAACTAAQGVAGAVDLVGDISAVFTCGITAGIKEIVMGAIKGAALAGAMILITSVLSAITPTIAQWFTGKLSHAFLGIPGGYSLQSGTQNIYNSNLQMSTGRYASKENAIEVFGLTKEEEKEWAYYERATRSPFDVTSQYTFLGSIYNSMLPIVNRSSGGTIVSTVSSLADLTGTSALALVSPSVSAANEVDNFTLSLASDDNCSSLKSVGVAGDFACNKYAGAYVEELTSLDPETIYERMPSESFSGIDSYGNPIVNEDSEYARWIVACPTNDVQPGNMSGAVASFVQKGLNAVTSGNIAATGLINFGSNFIPFEGAIDIAEAVQEEINLKWNSGYACTGNTNDPELNERVKTYSMYNLDQRVLYDMGITESNSTMAFLEKYYEENPLDNSFEGQIARISGMDKEEVLDTLALIEYYDFVANYNPSGRYAFGAPAVEEDNELKFDNENTMASDAILLNVISFADIRNRTFAV